jgi:hypothetical protein
VTLASLRPVLEYGWPPGARWLADSAGSGRAVLEQPTRRPVAFRLRFDEGWRLAVQVELPEGPGPALAWARIRLLEPGGKGRTLWQGALARAGARRRRLVEVDLGAGDGELDLVLDAAGLGADRVRWIDPVFRREVAA